MGFTENENTLHSAGAGLSRGAQKTPLQNFGQFKYPQRIPLVTWGMPCVNEEDEVKLQSHLFPVIAEV